MAEDVGSMEVKGIFRDAGLMIALARVKNDLSGIAHQAKTVTTDFVRLTEQSKKLQGVLGLIGGFSFFGLLASAPRTAAQLERIWLYVKLMFNVIDKHLSPAVKWLADQFENLYKWFKNLDPEWQKLISYGLAAGTALASVGIFGALASVGIGFLKGALVKLVLYISGTIIPALLGAGGLSFAIGIILGLFGAWVLDQVGVTDAVAKLGKSFRDAADDGNTLEAAIRLAAGPFTLLGDAIGILVGSRTWDDFKKDIKTMIKDVETLTNKYNEMLKVLGMAPQGSQVGIRGRGTEQVSAAAASPFGGIGSLAGTPTYTGGSTTTSNNKETTINNEISGNTFVMQNGMDVDEFMDSINKQQARSANWRTF
jgi:hypothetical protein